MHTIYHNLKKQKKKKMSENEQKKRPKQVEAHTAALQCTRESKKKERGVKRELTREKSSSREL